MCWSLLRGSRARRVRVNDCRPPRYMTSQGTAHGRFTRAIRQRNLFGAEMAIREAGKLSPIDALDYLNLLAEVKPEKLEPAALGWHGRLELEALVMTMAESQLALAALASLCNGERDAVEIRRRLLRRAADAASARVLAGVPRRVLSRETPALCCGCALA
jgi:hypothetical protein